MRQRIALRLYVAVADLSASAAARIALRNLRATLEEYDPAEIDVRVVDVSFREATAAIEEDRVVATPTLVVTSPRPRLWLIGTLEDAAALRRALDRAGVSRRGTSRASALPLPAPSTAAPDDPR